MHRLVVGQHVMIKRSNGALQRATIVGTSDAEQLIKVEWFENDETKGKEVELHSLLKVNPHLRAETESKPKPSKSSNLPVSSVSAPLSGLLNRSKTPGGIQRPSKEAATIAPGPVARNSPPVARVVPTKAAPIPTQASTKFAARQKENLEPKTAPVSTHEKIHELEAKREERRAKQSEAKRQKFLMAEVDHGSPNWQFLAMINEYRAQVDYRPLSGRDSVVDNRISVCVRKRPLDRREIAKKEIDVVTIPNKNHLIVHQPQVKVDLTKYLDNQKFRFDYTFDEDADNELVYKFTAQPLVNTMFEGGYATCFAYGQTGSGKTHTMCGAFQGKSQDCTAGIYALTAADVFRKLANPEIAKLKFIVKCSFFEIYGGKVFDLLGKRAALRVLEDGNKSVQVVGLSEVAVTNPDEVMELIRKGSLHRSAGTTSANANSSRSHAVFQLNLKRGPKEDLHGKISLIDLAGNERGADTTNSDRQTRQEGADINKSLLALKECIRSMSMNKNYVPFRLSKLTLVLRDSFIGENTKTCMIAMTSPGLNSVENTLNTLRYADRVKELGSDDSDGPAKPIEDTDFMIEDTDDDAEALKILSALKDKNIGNVLADTLLLRISTAEEKTVDEHHAVLSVCDKLQSLIEAQNNPTYDPESYAKQVIQVCDKGGKAIKALQESAKDLLTKIQKEHDQSKNNKRPAGNGNCNRR
uniref:Kinesin-like protein n=1 Tax=Panagrellus redivivus TaxID=6233 RepID=A0A7E4VPB0_PANRE